jgi:hypothetical protein
LTYHEKNQQDNEEEDCNKTIKQKQKRLDSKSTISNEEMVKTVMTNNVIQVPTIDIPTPILRYRNWMIPSMHHHISLPSHLRLNHHINSSTTIQIPHEHDVLLGRGGRNNQWMGNEILRRGALELCNQYRKAKKHEKSSIAWELVQKMHHLIPKEGRFVPVV